MGGRPEKIILLTCDVFVIIPSVSKLTPNQVMYRFISGYTIKVAGAESGIVKLKSDLFIPTKVEDVLFELLKSRRNFGDFK
jgi:ATP-dependent phosphoenolpyruvate carboxykinase